MRTLGSVPVASLLLSSILSFPPPSPPGQTEPAPPSVAVSGPQTAAEELYRQASHEAAAVQLFEVAQGRQSGDPARAQFWLAKSLFRAGYPAASLAAFDRILQQGPTHPYHRATLPWLAALSRSLPGGADVVARVGTFRGADLEDEALDDVRDELYFLLGRHRYESGKLGEAIALFSLVPHDSDYFVPAQFLIGVAETRELHGPEAVEGFKQVLRANAQQREQWQDEGKNLHRLRQLRFRIDRLEGAGKKRRADRLRRRMQRALDVTESELAVIESNERFEDRARLGLGYVLYQVGQFDRAMVYFDGIHSSSPYWLDAILAAAWAEFRAVEVDEGNANRHYQRTLGHVHTLGTPVFADRMYPEAPILKAVTYYFNCRYGAAKAAITEFHERYGSTRTLLRNMLDGAPEDFQLYELTTAIREDRSSLDPFVAGVASHALSDQAIERNYAYVTALDAEEKRLSEASGELRDGPLGEHVLEGLDLARSLAMEKTGALARQRLEEVVAEVARQERTAIKIEYEILNRLKAKGPDKPGEKQKPFVDREHEVYAYNGEIWADELGYYNYAVTSLCSE